MNEKLYYTADEIGQMIGVGRTKSYRIVRQLNTELEAKGYLTVGGKVPKEFFNEKYFGGSHPKEGIA